MKNFRRNKRKGVDEDDNDPGIKQLRTNSARQRVSLRPPSPLFFLIRTVDIRRKGRALAEAEASPTLHARQSLVFAAAAPLYLCDPRRVAVLESRSGMFRQLLSIDVNNTRENKLSKFGCSLLVGDVGSC